MTAILFISFSALHDVFVCFGVGFFLCTVNDAKIFLLSQSCSLFLFGTFVTYILFKNPSH